jgi:hypothetical protein
MNYELFFLEVFFLYLLILHVLLVLGIFFIRYLIGVLSTKTGLKGSSLYR